MFKTYGSQFNRLSSGKFIQDISEETLGQIISNCSVI